MTDATRRTFIKGVGAGVAATTLASSSRTSLGANEQVTIGVIGCGGRGTQLGSIFARQPDATVAYTCDPDRSRAEKARDAASAKQAVTDLRRVVEDKSVDAVVIAACDHWHAPAAIMACNAGKHVYVEKPCSHSLREGRLMVEAAGRNKCVMQHGTQTRSSETTAEAIQMLREGVIGDVLIAKHVNSQKRANIGHREPSEPPSNLDYDLWVGPAEWREYQSNYVHYHWHWFFNFGTGDIGNDGVHGIDVARWGLGVETHPSFVTGYGSKLFFDDDQEFPDSYSLAFEYPGDGTIGNKRVLIYEQRIWSPYRHDKGGTSIFFYGTQGMMTLSGDTIQVVGERNRPIKTVERKTDYEPAHQRDFLDAVRGVDAGLNADISVGHLSSSLCHLGNIVSRTGRAIRFDPAEERILDDDQAAAMLSRGYREGHWAVPQGA